MRTPNVSNYQSASIRAVDSSVVLTSGQIVQGKILKLYNHNKAQIQIGSQKMVAQIKASLDLGSTYHFQVQTSDEVILLKVLGETASNQSTENAAQLLQRLALKATAINTSFVEHLLNEQIPFTKEQLLKAFSLIKGLQMNSSAFSTIRNMIAQQLPLSESVFQALYLASKKDFSDNMKGVLEQLRQNSSSDELQRHLISQLSQLTDRSSFMNVSPRNQFLQHIQQVLQSAGFNYENLIATNKLEQKSNNLKAALLKMVQQSDGTLRESTQQLLHIFNGLQLQSVSESYYNIQASIQLPGGRLGLKKDIQLDFESKKTKNGQIDPEFCRILLYLDLANLQETIVDMHVQKRAAVITIYTEHEHAERASAAFQSALKKGLEAMDYQLSSLVFKAKKQSEKFDDKSLNSAYQPAYKGVDYRI